MSYSPEEITTPHPADATIAVLRARITSLESSLAEARKGARTAEAANGIAEEIVQIMTTYDEQIAKRGYVDTPGGLEHMGDVWELLDRWRDELTRVTAPQETAEKEGE